MSGPGEPRFRPLDDHELPADVVAAFAGRPVQNIFRVLAHHPDLLRRWLRFGNHVLYKSSLAPREVELLILRTGWLCGAEYEFGQHARIALRRGLLSGEEIERSTVGPASPSWSAREALLLTAVDELEADLALSDRTWTSLAAELSTEQILDLVFTVGQYHLVALAVRTLRVPLDEDLPGFPPGT